MNFKELKLKQCQTYVHEAEIRVLLARNELDHGYARLKTELERQYAMLKLNLDRADSELERARYDLEYAEAELSRSFEA